MKDKQTHDLNLHAIAYVHVCVFVSNCVNQCMQVIHHFPSLLSSLHLLSDDPVDLVGTPLDALCSHLQKHLQFKPGERDAIFLHHFIGIEWPDSKVRGGNMWLSVYCE